MARVKVYLRIAQTERGYKVKATSKPSNEPLKNEGYYGNASFPTIAFGLILNIDDAAFRKAEDIIGEIDIPLEKIKVNEVTIEGGK